MATTMLRKRLRDAGLGLGLTLLLFLLAEVVLHLAGLPARPPGTDLSRGFDAAGDYLVPDPETPKGWRTQFSDGKFPERLIPPKSERTRVVLFGGSNTQGFSRGWLERALNQGAAGQRFEVINLGRNGYGSDRVLILLEQALERIAPDIVVLYTGHNEFIERSFAIDLEEAWSSQLAQSAGDLARRSRLIAVVQELFEGALGSPHSSPAARRREYEKFANVSYKVTQQVQERFANNVAQMCERALESGVGVVLCSVIYNRYAAPFQSTLDPELTSAQRADFERAYADASAAMPGFVRYLLPEAWSERVYGFDWEHGPAQAQSGAARVELRPSLGPLAERDPLLPDAARWHPKVAVFLKALRRVLAGDFTQQEREQLERAEVQLGAAVAASADHPRALFELALVEQMLGRDAAVWSARYEQAGRFDRAPRKASEWTNELIRAVANERPDVLLFDADALFAKYVPQGLVGWEWMLDHCHLTIGARRFLLEELAAQIQSYYSGM